MMFQHHPRKCTNYNKQQNAVQRCGRLVYGHRCSGFCSLKCLQEYHNDPKYIRRVNHMQAMKELENMRFL